MNLRFSLLVALLAVASITAFARNSGSGAPTYPLRKQPPGLHGVPEDANWDDRFGPNGTDGEINAVAVDGNDIYIGGTFRSAGGVWTGGIARWNTAARQWSRIGSESDIIDGTVMAIAINQGKIYIGGKFTRIGTFQARNLAIYDIASGTWSAWSNGAGGGGLSDGYVTTLLVSGSDIYVGGYFTAIGTILANNIARWDGTRFRQLDLGVNSEVSAMTLAGGSLYAGGDFITAGEVSASRVARWNGTRWSALGSGTSGFVRSLASDGEYLYVGGRFDSAGGLRVNNVARFRLASGAWSGLGGGVRMFDRTLQPVVNAIQPVNGLVFIGGDFRHAGGKDTVRNIVIWDGQKLAGPRKGNEQLCHGVGRAGNAVKTMALGDDGLYLAGLFEQAYEEVQLVWDIDPSNPNDAEYGPTNVFNIVRWDLLDREWRAIGHAPDGLVHSLAIDGDDIYFGGDFRTIGGIAANSVARWNSRTSQWSALGEGIARHVGPMIVQGERLLACTKPMPGDRVTKNPDLNIWDRRTGGWTRIGSLPLTPFAFAASASELYIAGSRGIFRLVDSTLEQIETVGMNGLTGGTVHAMALDGTKLYIGGEFTRVRDIPVRNIAVLDIPTGRWSSVGNGLDDVVRTLAFDRGRLYVGGDFLYASPDEALDYVAIWDPSSGRWESMGGGMNQSVSSIAVRDGLVYAAGIFTTAGEAGALRLAVWDGEIWSALGSGLDAYASAVVAGEDQVIVAGEFTHAGEKPSYLIGRWGERSLSAPVRTIRLDHGVSLEIAPNPASSSITISFDLPSSTAPVRIGLYNALGTLLAIPFEGREDSGDHTVQVDVSRLRPGVYYCRLQQGEHRTILPFVVER